MECHEHKEDRIGELNWQLFAKNKLVSVAWERLIGHQRPIMTGSYSAKERKINLFSEAIKLSS